MSTDIIKTETNYNPLTPYAKRMLRLVCKVIKEEPRRLDMSRWYNKYSTDTVGRYPNLPPCGTVACIAGHITLHSRKFSELSGIAARAKKILNLTEDQAGRLFYDAAWPLVFRHRYANHNSATEAAQIAIERIEYFIETDGTDGRY